MKEHGKASVLACLLALLAVAGIIIGVRYKERAELRAQYQELCEQYTIVLNKEVPAKMESLKYYKSTEIDAVCKIGEPDSNGRRTRYSRYYVTVHVSDEFDRVGENDQFEYLEEVKDLAREAKRTVLEEHLPAYAGFSGSHQYPDVFGKHRMDYNEEDEYFVKTSRNLYQCAKYLDNYFIKNDEEVFTPRFWEIYHKKNPTPTPTPTPYARKPASGKSKYKYKSSADPYDVDQYDDPEDFWEENEDDFDDFEDAWDYWEEHQE